ncbi:MAG: DUF1836 domain-containing protein [Bacillaceae bacterium]
MNLDEMIEQLQLTNHISLGDIPKVDLYMDQVIQLFENTYNETTRTDEEKVLTKTMINNYAKGKLLPPIKNKKYSHNHIMLLSLIYSLKGALSINDIKIVLEAVNSKVTEDETFSIEDIYTSILTLHEKNTHSFKEELHKICSRIDEEKGNEYPEEIEQLLLISTLVQMSNQYRRVAEKLVDELTTQQNKKKAISK